MKLTARSLVETFGQSSLIFENATQRMQQYLKTENSMQESYKTWEVYFKRFYKKGEVNQELFFKHAYLIILVVLILHVRQNKQKLPLLEALSDWIHFLNDQEEAEFNYNSLKWVIRVPNLAQEIYAELKDAELEEEDIFRLIYQQMISISTRQRLGEFYTPPELAGLMITEVYKFGERVLDPACGSGTFLVELVKLIKKSKHPIEKQLRAIQNLLGFDINPISVAVSKANLLLHTANIDHGSLVLNKECFPAQIYLCDALFPSESLQKHIAGTIDLTISNPPWIVINGLDSTHSKQKIKDLAKKLHIAPRAKDIHKLELSAVFLYRCRQLYMKKGGKIFFIVSNAFMTGTQHEGTRRFNGFKNIRIWRFKQDLFRIHNICLLADKMDAKANDYDNLEILVTNMTPTEDEKGNLVIKRGKTEIYVPYAIEKIKNGDQLVKRLIPQHSLSKLLPRGKSPYYNKFYQGATLVPRSFIFVHIKEKQGLDSKIVPNTTVQTKPPWKSPPYSEAWVESKYLFPVAKSTELVPFAIFDTVWGFLPIEKDSLMFESSKMGQKAKKHFEILDHEYQKRQKKGAVAKNLWSLLNYHNNLSKFRQKANLKVVYNSTGGSVKSAIVKNQNKNQITIIDTKLYFMPTDNENEAYYLCGILNAPCITEDVKKRGSTGAGGGLRNVHKIPLTFNIPLFDEKQYHHQKIAEKARQIENQVQEIIERWDRPIRFLALRNYILKNLQKSFKELNVLVLELFNSL
ncbi:MAG: class I SAM-dependent DNA methyltransferase [Candidatus Hermodarchaeota archaeon]